MLFDNVTDHPGYQEHTFDCLRPNNEVEKDNIPF